MSGRFFGHPERDLEGLRIDDHSPARRWDSIPSPETPAKQLKLFLTPFPLFSAPQSAGAAAEVKTITISPTADDSDAE